MEDTRRAAPAPPAAAAAVPEDVAALLSSVSLSAHGTALCNKLGVASVADLALVTDAMLREELPALRAVERAKLLVAVSRAAGPVGRIVVPLDAAPAGAELVTAPGACDVMISYRVPESGAGPGGDSSVFALQAALQARGYSVFVGEGAIEGGDFWPVTIQNGVRHCKAFVVLCSPTYGDRAVSPWTFDELTMAKNNRKPLLPVWHSGYYPPPSVEIMLGGLQRIPGGDRDMRAVPMERVVTELARALQRVGVAPSSAPVAAVPAAACVPLVLMRRNSVCAPRFDDKPRLCALPGARVAASSRHMSWRGRPRSSRASCRHWRATACLPRWRACWWTLSSRGPPPLPWLFLPTWRRC
jgi:hypothetical protein